MRIQINNIDKLNIFSNKFGRHLQTGDVVNLIGDLGAGKTTFVQGMKESLGIFEDITSPTFSLVNIYEGRETIYHLDLYRFEDADEILSLDYMTYFYPDGITFIEWGEKVKSYLPEDMIEIEIKYAEGGREIIIKENSKRALEILEAMNENIGN